MPLAIGLPLVALGIGLAASSVQTCRRVATDERYAEPTRVIVQHGPYVRTRNPMMLSILLIHAGVLLIANAGWGDGADPDPLSPGGRHFTGGALSGGPIWRRV